MCVNCRQSAVEEKRAAQDAQIMDLENQIEDLKLVQARKKDEYAASLAKLQGTNKQNEATIDTMRAEAARLCKQYDEMQQQMQEYEVRLSVSVSRARVLCACVVCVFCVHVLCPCVVFVCCVRVLFLDDGPSNYFR